VPLALRTIFNAASQQFGMLAYQYILLPIAVKQQDRFFCPA
jgi:hypothetical protein